MNSHFSYWHLWVFWNFVMSISRFWGSGKLELYFKPSCHRYCRKPSKSPASEEVACVRRACQGVPNEADGFNNSLQLDYDFTMWRGLKATLITEHDKVLKQKCWVLCKLADNFVNSTWVSDFTLFIVVFCPIFFQFLIGRSSFSFPVSLDFLILPFFLIIPSIHPLYLLSVRNLSRLRVF